MRCGGPQRRGRVGRHRAAPGPRVAGRRPAPTARCVTSRRARASDAGGALLRHGPPAGGTRWCPSRRAALRCAAGAPRGSRQRRHVGRRVSSHAVRAARRRRPAPRARGRRASAARRWRSSAAAAAAALAPRPADARPPPPAAAPRTRRCPSGLRRTAAARWTGWRVIAAATRARTAGCHRCAPPAAARRWAPAVHR
jgi:hypothetical protein